MAAIKKYNGSTWETTTARKYETKSEIIVPPTTIYCNGSNATLSIKGNTTQSGTPSPSNPVPVLGVGDLDGTDYKIPISSANTTTPVYLGEVETTRRVKKLVLTGDENWEYATTNLYTLTLTQTGMAITDSPSAYCTHFVGVSSRSSYSYLYSNQICIRSTGTQIWIRSSDITTVADFKSYLAAQYAAGTPVTVWYVLATEETGIVNEPLMKIGDYADALSNATAIPTTDGANSITVDTAVQPSEFTATWAGWHNANVKEWDGSQWQ